MKNNICISISEKPGNFGKIIHNAGYEALGLNWIYIPFKITNLEDTIKGIRALGIRGCSVSMPFKEKVIKFLDDEYYSISKKQNIKFGEMDLLHYIRVNIKDHKNLWKSYNEVEERLHKIKKIMED